MNQSVCNQFILRRSQKFEDSLGGNVKENGAAFLDLLTQAGGVEAGTEEVIQYLNLVEALSTYRPSRTYDGPTVAVKTTDPAFEVSLLINQSWPTHEQVETTISSQPL